MLKRKIFLEGSLTDYRKTYRVWIVLFILGNICDGASTVHFMLVDPTAWELHPVIALIVWFLGPIAGPLLGILAKALVGLGVAWYLHRFGRLGPICLFLVGIVMSFWADWYNVWGVSLYTPRFSNLVAVLVVLRANSVRGISLL